MSIIIKQHAIITYKNSDNGLLQKSRDSTVIAFYDNAIFV